MTLKGSVAVVTGGGAGIGRAITLRLAAEGARVAVLDIRQQTADESLELAGGDGVALACDVSDSSAVDATFARVESELGPPDILVNNAGAIGMDHLRRVKPLLARQQAEAANGRITTPLDALARLTDDEWRRMHAIHLDGTFFCTRAAVRSMGPRGTRRDREHVVDLRAGGLHRASPLLVGEGGHPRIHEGCRQGADRAGHPRQRGGSRPRRYGHARRARSPSSVVRSPSRRPPGASRSRRRSRRTVAFLASDDASYFVGAVLSPNGGLVTA